jgi:hypothetical protein
MAMVVVVIVHACGFECPRIREGADAVEESRREFQGLDPGDAIWVRLAGKCVLLNDVA